MATPDWPASRLRREERVAAKLVQRLNLEPPIDVGKVAQQFVDVELEPIPGECDGLVLGLQGGRARPLVLLDNGQAKPRIRFTLAHELGHVLLPWHFGNSFLCETSRVRLFEASADYNFEPEANRFAAELLVPSSWLDRLMAGLGSDRVAPLMDALRLADVSAYVACLRLREALPAGHTFVISRGGTVLISGRTQGRGLYAVNPPETGENFERERLDRFAHHVEDLDYGSTHVTWWTFRGEQPPAGAGVDSRSSRQVLDVMLERHLDDAGERSRVRASLGGVIGAAYGEATRQGPLAPAELYVRFRGRFAVHRPGIPNSLTRDPDFELWLHKRAEELG